jgi:hypothetical protein
LSGWALLVKITPETLLQGNNNDAARKINLEYWLERIGWVLNTDRAG